MKLRLGISTCPNDTFAFHGILERRVDLRGIEYTIVPGDVQELNEALRRGALQGSKASFHAALHLAGDYGILRSGSAVGHGVGPLLLASGALPPPAPGEPVLCPGAWTTATLLLRCFHPAAGPIRQRLFSEIMPALARGEAPFGVVIHEGRFTYRELGLILIEDLGARWELESGAPLPLGGILLRRDLGAAIHRRVHATLRDSIRYAQTHPAEAAITMRRHSQDLRDDVIQAHVKLYVNADTLELGERAIHALNELGRRARAAGLIGDAPALEILGD